MHLSPEELNTAVARLFVALREHSIASGTSMHQARVLARLRAVGPSRITDLAVAMQVSQPAMTELVQRLQGQGWVRREADDNDGRAVRISLSPEGDEALDAVVAQRARVLGEALAQLTEPDQSALADALGPLERLADALGSP